MSVREYDVAEKAHLFIFSNWFHDGFLRARQHFPRRLQVEEQRAKAIAVRRARPMINLQPARIRPDWRSTGPDTFAVPHAGTAACETPMPSPMRQVRRFRNPNIVAAQHRTARSMQRIVFAANLFLEDRAILVVRWKNHSTTVECAPIFCAAESHSHPTLRYLRKCEMVRIADLRHSAILDAI